MRWTATTINIAQKCADADAANSNNLSVLLP